MSRVDLDPIQKAVMEYLAKGHTWKDICVSLGWMESDTAPESSRLQKALGFRLQSNGKPNKKMNSDTAAKIIRAINRAPQEFDL